ncbi:MAG TPA: hypothetical protein VFA26_17240 [Gemmataceae bacterium]|nr:hypothetical protein [Gemmataceae bacterium]
MFVPTRRGRRAAPRPTPPAIRRWDRWAFLLLLAGYLLFCHGCHGDEDNELFALARALLGR